ncbi:MAG: amino acid permease [Blastocatellia bacterium]
MASQLFSTKSPDQLLRESENPERQMKRTLTAFDLTALGIGAIVGAGIFSLVGTASAGETFATKIKTPLMNFIIAGLTGTDVQLGRQGAGPAIVISLTLAAVACAFAAFCYAELASMIPVSGSAYTYSYATLGELFAWIIGWDLILEYAVGNMAVAVSWSGYFIKLLYALFGLKLPLWLVSDHTTATAMIKDNSENLQYYSSTVLPNLGGMEISLNLPALLIVLLLTVLLVYGIRESARANTIAVVIKMAVLIFFVAFGAFYVSPTNWTPFNPNGVSGIMTGSAIIFFAFIGFDAVSTTAEEAKNPKRDLPIGIIASLVICTILYVLVAGVMTGLKHYSTFAGDASPIASAIAVINKPWLQALISAGALAGSTSVLLVFQLGQPRIFMAMGRDGLLPTYFSKIHPKYRTPHITTIWTGIVVGLVAMVTDIGSLADLTNIGTLFAFILVCFGVIVLRKTQPNRERSFRVPWVPIFPIVGAIFCLALMLSLPLETWRRFIIWLVVGLVIYFAYGFWNSKMRAK